ncbi:hypothetical protein BKA65DRAFT_61958 [Rhexocercosporidium sp. MPI-PUGE-AT-0058]|nr:hypothetical protein BKA65DRAFT_61958 [Rhexocercosporidium sp. MPI-PUGE-AT-0058]
MPPPPSPSPNSNPNSIPDPNPNPSLTDQSIYPSSITSLRSTITSLDTLASLLCPQDLVRVPGSHAKVPGEIRPRSKSLQQILRCVMFFKGSEWERREIEGRMERRVLCLMKGLEERIEADLRGVEDVIWPRRIIKFDSPTSSPEGAGLGEDESPYWIVRASTWVCELTEEIWEDGGEIASCCVARLWELKPNGTSNVLFWVVGLIVGLAFMYLYTLSRGA